MSTFQIKPFFPDKNLNPQGWVTDFITSRLHRVDTDRSDLANLLYDEVITEEAVRNFGITGSLKSEIETVRKRSSKDQSIYLNPKYYDAVERNTSISSKVVEDEKKMRDYYRYMTNIKPNELSSLLPYVHMKYCYKNKNDKEYKEVEVPFVQNLKTEVSSILADQFSRGQGAGIKSISANRSFPGLGLTLNIDINISYFFSSISLITKKISNPSIPEDRNFSYSKLFCWLANQKERFVLEYGYGINPSDSNVTYKNKDDIVNMEKKRILLYYKGHKLNIQEDGTVTVDVNYTALSEAQLFQRNDVASPSLDFLQKADWLSAPQRSILEKYNQINKTYEDNHRLIQDLEDRAKELNQIGNNKSSKEIKSIEKQKLAIKKSLEVSAKQLTALRTETIPLLKQFFIKELIRRRRMFGVHFVTSRKDSAFQIQTTLSLQTEEDPIELKSFITTENLSDYKPLLNKDALKNNKDLTEENLFEALLVNLFDGVDRTTPGKPFGHTLFFPLKALISIIYDLLDDKVATLPLPYLCLGNVTARSFSKEYSLNIGDILIERETFMKWLYKNFDQKIRMEYSFSAILKDIMEELVPEALYRNNTGFHTKNSIGAIRHLVYYTENPTEKQISEIYKGTADFSKLREIFTPEYKKNAKPMIYYTQMLSPLNDYTSPYHRKYIARKVNARGSFDLDSDSALGIPHVSIGSSTGLIKKTSFNIIEQPALATSLVMQSMADGNTRLPRYAYNVEVEMFGNNLFSQAGFLAVPPFGASGDVDVSLGITGYYVINKVSDSIGENNVYSTKISAIFHDNPLQNKNKKFIATTKQNNSDKEGLQEYIDYTAKDYVKELLELDPTTLKALGITAQKEVKTDKSDQQKKQEKKKKPKMDQPK